MSGKDFYYYADKTEEMVRKSSAATSTWRQMAMAKCAEAYALLASSVPKKAPVDDENWDHIIDKEVK